MGNGRYLMGVLVVALVVSNVVFAYKYFQDRAALAQLQKTAEVKTENSKVLDFAGLFVEKVLKANKEVSFEDRLRLENAVRNLNDQEILDAWNVFVNSQTQEDAQSAVKNLLGVLVTKMWQTNL